MTNSDKIIELVKSFDLSMLDAKRMLTTQYIMSVEEYDKNLLIIMPAVYYADGETKTEQIVFIMGKNYIVTIRESNHPFDIDTDLQYVLKFYINLYEDYALLFRK